MTGLARPAQAQLFGPGSPSPFAPAAPAPAVVPASPIVAPAAPAPAVAATGAASEFRGLWVDSYREGFKTPDQADRLLADARRANVNALLVQVRRRGDSFYARSLEPRTDDPDLAPGFDPLAYLIERAHNDQPRVEIHAWMIMTAIWGNQTSKPADPRHVFNLHGLGANGGDDWLTKREDGATWSRGYFMDPGHPDAAQYTTDVMLKLVREYDVDGLHLDYIRYPERADGLSWGYNDASIARFNTKTGQTGRPGGNDPAWNQWRRDQVSALVRGIYTGSMAIKPQVKISAAVIPWGDGPRSDADWQRAAAYSSVFQDWRSWLEEGILDQAMPMTYFREATGSQGTWFDHWVSWARDHAYGRHIVPAVALYMNDPAGSIAQVRRALADGPGGNRTAGVALYSYGATRQTADGDDTTTTRAQAAEVWSALVEPGSVNGGQPPFASRAIPPGIAWKSGNTLSGSILPSPALDGPLSQAAQQP
jgi:uncharacterized lipoprotein YddW (UPF0748 family)